MPSEVAAFLCFTFILAALILDIRQKPNVSSALWIPLIWLIIGASRSLSLWVYGLSGYSGVSQSSVDSIEEGSAIDRIFLIIMIILGIYVLLKRKVKWALFFRENKWVIFLYIVCVVSLLWSDFPYVAFKRWIKGFGVLLMSTIVLTEHDRLEALKTIVKRCAYILIPLSILLVKYYRNLGVFYDEYGAVLAGVATGKNSLGLLCAICGIFFVWYISTEWRDQHKAKLFYQQGLIINIIIMMMIFLLFNIANSATSLICFIIGVITYMVLGLPLLKNNQKEFRLWFTLIIIFSLPIILITYDAFAPSVIEHTGHGNTFWDRVKLWNLLLTMDTSPLFGAGYDSFWLGERLKKLRSIYWWSPTQAHNGYLDVYLELGLIGLFFWAGVIFYAFRNVYRTLSFDYDFGRFQMAFMTMFLMHNVTESSLKIRSFLWFIFLLIILYYPQRLTSSKSQGIPEGSAG